MKETQYKELFQRYVLWPMPLKEEEKKEERERSRRYLLFC
jgi:hypothetical protein